MKKIINKIKMWLKGDPYYCKPRVYNFGDIVWFVDKDCTVKRIY